MNKIKKKTAKTPSKYRYLNGRGDELDERAVNAANQGLRALKEASLDEAIAWFRDAIGHITSIKAESREAEAATRVPTPTSVYGPRTAAHAKDDTREENIRVWGDPKG